MSDEITILLIDDDEDDRELFIAAASEIDRPVKCETACNGKKALEYLDNCNKLPDFIFLDLNMPVMDGKKCLKQIKSSKKFASIPVIIYSTSKHAEIESELMKMGAELFIKKPVVFDEICQAISSVVSFDKIRHGLFK